MKNLPTLFVSHGSPMLSLEDGPARRFLAGWSARQVRPKAILVVSAHWETSGGVAVSTAEQPRTIHDFGGFPRELYELQYAAPGAPDVARQTIALLRQAGFAVSPSDSRGLDHGAWVPLRLMYPDADIPVFQVSLIHGGSPAEHYRIGAALQPLRAQGVLVMGSGSATHNLYEIMGHGQDDPVEAWVSEFDQWLAATLQAGKVSDLLDYRRLAPHAVRNHPTEEHLLPLFVALGAAGAGAAASHAHASHTYGILAMDAYTFSDAGAPA
ncbi:MAG TPA: class III extradiol ring-cleavage dioxygenase [Gallionellaceae bacterium]|nr:class III extradiol ring-cleavage dioxygenase [Gallionellaceae bacterium]